jgi:hypothetical protein
VTGWEPEAVLLSVDDLKGLELTLEILGDTEVVARLSGASPRWAAASQASTSLPCAPTWLAAAPPAHGT